MKGVTELKLHITTISNASYYCSFLNYDVIDVIKNLKCAPIV